GAKTKDDAPRSLQSSSSALQDLLDQILDPGHGAVVIVVLGEPVITGKWCQEAKNYASCTLAEQQPPELKPAAQRQQSSLPRQYPGASDTAETIRCKFGQCKTMLLVRQPAEIWVRCAHQPLPPW